VDLVQKFD